MEMDSIFQNKIFLTLKNKKAEKDFDNFLDQQRTNCNKWFSGFLLLINLIDIIFQNIVLKHSLENFEGGVAYIMLYSSFILVCFSLVTFILGFFIQNAKFKIFISSVNYFLIMIPFDNIRNVLFRGGYAKEQVLAILRTFEVLVNVIMIMLVLVAFPTGLYQNLILLILVIVYNCLIREYYWIFYYFLAVVVYILISYFYTKSLKESFFTDLKHREQISWYNNLFEHTHSGFMSFGNHNNINLINKTLFEKIHQNKEIAEILKSESNEEQNKILPTNATDDLAMKVDVLKRNSEKVLNILLRDINYGFQENKEFMNKDFDLKDMISIYENKKINENFLLIGFKDLEVESLSESFLNSNTSFEKNKDIITFEVFFRYRNWEFRENYQFEVILYDVSNTKKFEEKNAELKYKTMFLSKIAHEFKNPLICVSELVNTFKENYSNELKTLSHFKNSKSPKTLKQIIIFVDYMLILMKDLDLFSQLQIKKEINVAFEKVDTYEIFNCINQMAEILLLKFNKQNNVEFMLENNIPDNVAIFTDGIKLKQVLINLISNAIKFTNLGKIRLKADQISNDSDENLIRFEVSDTGVGMTNNQLQNLHQPFKMASGGDTKYGSGLGLFIVTKILHQLKSEIYIKSKVGEGTVISFSLPFKFEENKENDSKHTIELCEGENALLIAKSEIQIKDEEEEQIVWFKSKEQSKEYLIQPNVISSSVCLPQIEEQLECEIFKMKKLRRPQQECSYFIFVDDEHFTRKSSMKVLEKTAKKLNKKIEIFDVEDGIECLYLIYRLIKNGYRINAIVCDELMNHMNGTLLAEVLKKIKNLNTDTIPFFLLTAYPEIKNGFVDSFLSKPLNIKDAELILNSDNK